MKGCAVLRDVEIAIPLSVKCPHVHPKVEQMPHAFGIPVAREFREELSPTGEELADEPRFFLRNGTDLGGSVRGAGGDESFDSLDLGQDALAIEQVKHTPASSSGGKGSERVGCGQRDPLEGTPIGVGLAP